MMCMTITDAAYEFASARPMCCWVGPMAMA